ncbi:MAG: organic solvent tolerance protein OstA [Quinella sp. 1Q5]|nr:organic solvent tolerance protein OstA [Quinella sp. 1Q5]
MIKKICAACVATMLISSVAMAEDKKDNLPSEVNADAIEYDMNTGVVAAEGNVLLKHGTAKATGLHALFNVNTKEAQLIGNVIVVREDMRITCNALMSNGQGHMMADGNVIATQNLAPNEKYPNGDTRTFTGEHIDYFSDDRKHVIIPNGGLAKSEVEGTFTADKMEGWIDDERYLGTGNAHLISKQRNLEAGGDQVDYDGKQEGKAVVTGNAWAIQDNNTIRGNRLTVYLADDGTLKAEPKVQMPEEFSKAFEQKPEPDKTSEPEKTPTQVKEDTVTINPDEATANES